MLKLGQDLITERGNLIISRFDLINHNLLNGLMGQICGLACTLV
jgi:hypothetical protein